MYNNPNQELHDRLIAFLLANSGRTGAKVLGVLHRNPDRYYSVIEIACRVYHYDLSPLALEAIAKNAFRGIPSSDEYARKQYLTRLQELNRRRCSGEANLDWEIDWLKKELRRITKPNGAIKNEYPEMMKAYHCFKMALNRLIARANTRDPDLADYIRSHLKTGLWCCWHKGDMAGKRGDRQINRRGKTTGRGK